MIERKYIISRELFGSQTLYRVVLQTRESISVYKDEDHARAARVRLEAADRHARRRERRREYVFKDAE
jgi:hypothetical protein